MDTIFRHLTIINDQGRHTNQKLTLRDGAIARIDGDTASGTLEHEVDCRSLVALPACIDLSSRAFYPSYSKKKIDENLRALYRNGFAHVCIPSTFDAPWDNPLLIESLTSTEEHATRVAFLPPLTKGHHGKALTDMSLLIEAGARGFSQHIETFSNSAIEYDSYRYASQFRLPIHVVPLDSTFAKTGVSHDGSHATEYGLRPIPVIAETAPMLRALELGRHTDNAIHISDLSSKESVALLQDLPPRFLKRCTASVSIFHLLFDETDIHVYDSRHKHLPPLRSTSDRGALRAGLEHCVIQAISSRHSSRAGRRAPVPFQQSPAGVPSASWFLLALWSLAEQGDISYKTISLATSSGPAKILGLPSTEIAVGNRAHFVLINQKKTTRIEEDNCNPFSSKELPGRIDAIVEGTTLLQT